MMYALQVVGCIIAGGGIGAVIGEMVRPYVDSWRRDINES